MTGAGLGRAAAEPGTGVHGPPTLADLEIQGGARPPARIAHRGDGVARGHAFAEVKGGARSSIGAVQGTWRDYLAVQDIRRYIERLR